MCLVELRSAHGDESSQYTIERVRAVCAHLLANLQESHDDEMASASTLMITEVC